MRLPVSGTVSQMKYEKLILSAFQRLLQVWEGPLCNSSACST